MPKLRPTLPPAPKLPPQVSMELERVIAIVIQIRQELTKETKRLDHLEQELRQLLQGPQVPITPLTDLQVEVLRALALGETNAEIGRRLHLSPGAVNTTLGRIYRKLNVRNRNEATFTAWKLGLI